MANQDREIMTDETPKTQEVDNSQEANNSSPNAPTPAPAEQGETPVQPVSEPVVQPTGPAPDVAPTPSVAEMAQSQGVAPVPPVPPVAETPPAPEPPAPVADAPAPEPAPPVATPPVADATPAADSAATAASDPAAAAEAQSTAERVKEKLGAGSAADRALGSEDIKTQRPETPIGGPVDIPEQEDIGDSLQAEIESAMGQTDGPVTTAPVAEEIAGLTASPVAEGETPPVPEAEEIGPGSKVSGKVQHIHGDDIFVAAGLVADVVVSLKQFPEGKIPEVGTELSLVVETIDADGLIRARLPSAKTKTRGNWDALQVGQVVECSVTGTNKGGLQVMVSNLKGFLPASQVDLGFVNDMEQYVGQKMTVQLTEVNPRKRNLVCSRKVLLLAEREEAQAGFWETLEVGQDMTGTVKTLKNYGAFVNLGPIDGFLHIGEISWSRIGHPNEVLKEGQTVGVRILKIDREKNRISLGMKQTIQNPWENLAEKYPSERVVEGKVTRVSDFGAFVELEPGVEGLVHISELAWRRVGSVSEVLKVGEEKEFQVLEVDPKRKRVSLSLKALEKKPESARRDDPPQDDRPPRKPNPNLRGGMGGNKNGGLFGNPNDFT